MFWGPALDFTKHFELESLLVTDASFTMGCTGNFTKLMMGSMLYMEHYETHHESICDFESPYLRHHLSAPEFMTHNHWHQY